MTTVKQVMAELKKLGSEQTRKTFARHGADTTKMFGVRVGDLKPIAKKIKGEQNLACELFATGNYDAMYLAGIVADGALMTKALLNKWANDAEWRMVSEYSVPGVASESKHCRDLALKWMKSRKENDAACGWNTYAGLLATRPDDELDQDEIARLLDKIETEIGGAKNRVKYVMNGFVISVGTYVKPLAKKAKQVAKSIGKVDVDVGDTSCKIPLATEYIAKVEKAGRVGKKRKSFKC